MDDLLTLEKRVREIYESILYPLGEQVGFEFAKGWKNSPGSPTVLFLGNHSSGKSSFINYLLGIELQKSGLAPTDDGFTIITYGEKADEFDGQTVVTHRHLAFSELQKLGPAFLARLRLKTYPHDLLRAVTLIDSPGMIDAAGKAHSRGYDFASAVRHFSEQADLILFFFDPDKPGTTGETVSIFTETLVGLEYKLLIILNKVDLFSTIRDFARTYGTLCWNLSKTVRTKDMPHIFNTYIPGRTQLTRADGSIPLSDFDDSRAEVVQEIQRAPTRRSDNLISDLYQDAGKLAMHSRVFEAVARQYRNMRRRWIGIIGLELLLTVLAVWLFWSSQPAYVPWVILLTGLLLAVGLGIAARYALNGFRERAADSEFLDPIFQSVYHRDLAFQDRADLRAVWETIRNTLAIALRVIGPERPSPYALRRQLRRLDKTIEQDVLPLRRDVAQYHRQRHDLSTASDRPSTDRGANPNDGRG